MELWARLLFSALMIGCLVVWAVVIVWLKDRLR